MSLLDWLLPGKPPEEERFTLALLDKGGNVVKTKPFRVYLGYSEVNEMQGQMLGRELARDAMAECKKVIA